MKRAGSRNQLRNQSGKPSGIVDGVSRWWARPDFNDVTKVTYEPAAANAEFVGRRGLYLAKLRQTG